MEALLYAAAAVTAIAAAFGAVAKWIVLPIVKLLREFRQFLEDWNGEPERPGVPARPGLLSRVRFIEAELRPNGGGSLRDAVNRIEKHQHDHVNDSAAHRPRPKEI